MWQRILIVAVFCVIGPFVLVAAEDDSENDSSAVLPKEYAGKYLLAENTLSPDKTIGVIYPKTDLCAEEEDKDCKDYLVQLKPFKILEMLDTKLPHFQNKNHGGISADWSKDRSAVLVMLDSKWGPGDIFLYEFKDGQLTRSTNLLRKIHDLLEPDFRKAKSGHYNDYFDFIFESEEKPMLEFKDSTVQIHATATTDPKQISGEKAWDGEVEAVWDIPRAKFTSQKVKRLFAGVRKEE
jgi:hypothetical protein